MKKLTKLKIFVGKHDEAATYAIDERKLDCIFCKEWRERV